MKKLLDSNDVASLLGVCQRQATTLMEKMEHIDIGTGKKRTLRVTEEALELWIESKTVSFRRPEFSSLNRMPRKKGGRIIAG